MRLKVTVADERAANTKPKIAGPNQPVRECRVAVSCQRGCTPPAGTYVDWAQRWATIELGLHHICRCRRAQLGLHHKDAGCSHGRKKLVCHGNA